MSSQDLSTPFHVHIYQFRFSVNICHLDRSGSLPFKLSVNSYNTTFQMNPPVIKLMHPSVIRLQLGRNVDVSCHMSKSTISICQTPLSWLHSEWSQFPTSVIKLHSVSLLKYRKYRCAAGILSQIILKKEFKRDTGRLPLLCYFLLFGQMGSLLLFCLILFAYWMSWLLFHEIEGDHLYVQFNYLLHYLSR